MIQSLAQKVLRTADPLVSKYGFPHLMCLPNGAAVLMTLSSCG